MHPLEKKRKKLPRQPGVYIFRGDEGVLYVGKAKSLRARVGNYFPSGDGRPRIREMIQKAKELEVILTSDEGEALQLEQRLIKLHRPPYNARLREGHDYPYLAVPLKTKKPRIQLTTSRTEKGYLYFGPYPSSKQAREILKMLNRVLPHRVGKLSWDSNLKGLDDKRDQSLVDQIPSEEYQKSLDLAMAFLRGHFEVLENQITQDMRVASTSQDFERAGRLRDQLRAIQRLSAPRRARKALPNADVIAYAQQPSQAAIEVLCLREGDLTRGQGFILEETEDAELMENFCLSYYDKDNPPPGEVILSSSIGEDLMTFLNSLRAKPTRIVVDPKGERGKLLALAQENAYLSLRMNRQDGLLLLGQLLGWDSLHRIECYDISNLQDQAPVGAMVVFQDGEPKSAHYRKFNLQGGPDDYAQMRAVLKRRFSHIGQDSKDQSLNTLPDLIVIDGGKGQLSAALKEVNVLPNPPLMLGLAKREEEIFLAGRKTPICLLRDSGALLLLQRLRDEAHRFAISAHRTKRAKSLTSSRLDEVSGIGPKRRKLLLSHFGSFANIQQASLVELEAVLPTSVAKHLWEELGR